MSFRLCGVRFELSFYFFALLAAFFVFEPDGAAGAGALSAVIHESGHLAAMLLSEGVSVDRISVGVCGLRIQSRNAALSRPWPIICVAGVIANLCAFIVISLLLLLIDSSFCRILASANLLLGALNLLPVEAMDGGQLLRILLCKRLPPERCDAILFGVSLCFLIPLSIAGLLLLINTRYNFSLLILCMFLLCSAIFEYFRT